MAFYLLQENGDKIILEQGGGFLILEETPVPGTSVIYGGDDAPRRRRRRTYYDLFHEIEQTIHQLMAPESAPAEIESAETGGTRNGH